MTQGTSATGRGYSGLECSSPLSSLDAKARRRTKTSSSANRAAPIRSSCACAARLLQRRQLRRCVSRIRDHMREYIAHLPDYTCRITLERFKRPKARVPLASQRPFAPGVAYTGGRNYTPGRETIVSKPASRTLLPGRSAWSLTAVTRLHVRNLFLRDVAEFSAPHDERNARTAPASGWISRSPPCGAAYSPRQVTAARRLPWSGSGVVRRGQSRYCAPGSPRGRGAAFVRIAATRETTVIQRATHR